MNTMIILPDVCERDIDLLLLEEFVATSEFRSWFLKQLELDQTASFLDISRSVFTKNGETDLDLSFQGKQGIIKILIENKVDAAFQPDQPERYTERSNDYRKNDNYQSVITVVIAPSVYFGNEIVNYKFDYKITYESVLSWFKESSKLGSRKDYKIALLSKAIERGRIGWKLVPHENVSQFWHSYWELAEKIAPQLAMPVPKSDIPAESHFIKFRPSLLPSNVSLWHKVGYGHVDLQFAEMGDKLVEMEERYRNVLLPTMRIEKAAKSAVIRMRIRPTEMTTEVFSNCEPLMQKGIEAAALLLDWFCKVHTTKS